MFEDHKLDTIVFELENGSFPNPLGDEQHEEPNEEPKVLAQDGGYQPLGWHDLEAEMLNYDGDSEKDDDKDDEEGEDSKVEGIHDNYVQYLIVDEDATYGNDDIIKECMDLFEGYQSKYDNEYFSDSELEPEKVKIAKLKKGKPFKKMVGDEIKFHVGDGFPWRAHGSRMIDRMMFMIKTLADEHECHRVYNNKESKVKLIAYKFEIFIKSNPSVTVKVIGDLLRENYKVSVDVQRLYKAKKIALAGLT
ncbi:hypothetical protein Dsin_012843 [Dipteronia sinensis]|uniref:Uncharacterized protein n=1 Tax=Dipteronia sinensis TaxID=43782 RepID=A0AAE0E8B3_9ROSI|nr:hypothetical protein Dsin_012843 [Dipteronia sinensis]